MKKSYKVLVSIMVLIMSLSFFACTGGSQTEKKRVFDVEYLDGTGIYTTLDFWQEGGKGKVNLTVMPGIGEYYRTDFLAADTKFDATINVIVCDERKQTQKTVKTINLGDDFTEKYAVTYKNTALEFIPSANSVSVALSEKDFSGVGILKVEMIITEENDFIEPKSMACYFDYDYESEISSKSWWFTARERSYGYFNCTDYPYYREERCAPNFESTDCRFIAFGVGGQEMYAQDDEIALNYGLGIFYPHFIPYASAEISMSVKSGDEHSKKQIVKLGNEIVTDEEFSVTYSGNGKYAHMQFRPLPISKSDLLGDEGEILLTLTVYKIDVFVKMQQESGKTEFTKEETDEIWQYMNLHNNQYLIRIILKYKIEDGKVTFS